MAAAKLGSLEPFDIGMELDSISMQLDVAAGATDNDDCPAESLDWALHHIRDQVDKLSKRIYPGEGEEELAA